jgi:DNA-binding XRE family transcriptional regulator
MSPNSVDAVMVCYSELIYSTGGNMARKSINAIIGGKIRELRKERGMSQMRLAALVGVSYQQIQKYEKASGSISVERLEQISKAFKFPIREFFPAEIAKPLRKSKK